MSNGSNTYLVSAEISCVIDPGISAERLLTQKRDYIMSADVLINTHCHFDHVGANIGLLKNRNLRCFCHAKDAPALEGGDDSYQLASLFGSKPVKHAVDVKLEGGSTIDLNGLTLEVIHTPGHTPGSICLFEPESRSLFTGDTVFVGSYGRYDFKEGSFDKIRESIRLLAKLVEEKGVETIYPGHGPAGTGADLIEVFETCF